MSRSGNLIVSTLKISEVSLPYFGHFVRLTIGTRRRVVGVTCGLAIECCGVWSTITETSYHGEDHIQRQLERSTCQPYCVGKFTVACRSAGQELLDMPAKTGAVLRPEDYSCYLLSSFHGSDAAHTLLAVTARIVMAGLLISTSQHHASYEQCLSKIQGQRGGIRASSLKRTSKHRRMKEPVRKTRHSLMASSVRFACVQCFQRTNGIPEITRRGGIIAPFPFLCGSFCL